jgi:hypothetical protein
MKSDKGSLALKYLDLGWSVIPITAKKTPYLKEWKPYQTKRPTTDEIKSWWAKWPNANIAVATGPVSDLAVLDFDSRDALDHFQAAVEELPQTIVSHTPRGYHYFFKYPKSGLPNAAHIAGDDLDLRGAGGYVIIPPSTSGKKFYQWNGIDPAEDGLDDLFDMPDRILSFLRQNIKGEKAEKKNPEGWASDLLWEGAGKGERNQKTTKLVGLLFRESPQDRDGILLKITKWNKERNKPPLKDEEIVKIVNSIAEREGANTFGGLIGYTVTNLKRLIYPDGKVKYHLFIEDVEKPLVLESPDITNFNTFNQKFIDSMGRAIFKPVKKLDFLQQFDQLLQQAEIVEVDEEESIMATVREIIDRMKTPYQTTTDVNAYIDSNPVVYDDKLILKMMPLMRTLKTEHETKRLSRVEVVFFLKTMGFNNNNGFPVRFGNGLHRIWQIDYNKFKEKL